MPLLSFTDGLPSDTLHSQGPSEEDPLFHRPAGSSAPHPLWVWDVTVTLHEDDFSSHYDRNDPNQV